MKTNKIYSIVIILLILSSGFTASIFVNNLSTIESIVGGSIIAEINQQDAIFTVTAEDGINVFSDGESVKFSQDLGNIIAPSVTTFNITLQNSNLPDTFNAAWIHVDGLESPVRMTASIDTSEEIYRVGGSDWILQLEQMNRRITFSLAIPNDETISQGMNILLDFSIKPYQSTFESTAEPEMISYWRFDEGSGSNATDSIGENEGTIYGATWTTGINGSALSFDGIDDYVEIPYNESFNSLSENGEISIAAWILQHQHQDREIIIVKHEGGWSQESWRFGSTGTYNDNKLLLQLWDPQGSQQNFYGNTSVPTNEWHHVAVSWDNNSGEGRFYVDGEPAGDFTYQEGLKATDADLYIGSGSGVFDGDFYGKIDELKLFDTSLSSEILKIYDDSKPMAIELENSLISQWNLDENAGSTAYDSIGDNNGTINGAIWTDGVNGSALSFNGTDNYIEFKNSSNFNLGDTISFEAWVYPQDQNTSKIVQKGDWDGHGLGQDKWNGWKGSIYIDGDKKYSLSWNEGQPELNNWYHLVLTYDTSYIRLYVNGTEVDNETVSGNLRVNSRNICIGSDSGSQKFFEGTIDEVMIYNKGLSSTEVQNLYTLFNETIQEDQTDD